MGYLVINQINRPHEDKIIVAGKGLFANGFKYEVDWVEDDYQIIGSIPEDCYVKFENRGGEQKSLVDDILVSQWVKTLPIYSEEEEEEETITTESEDE